ncbi:MAG TPA: hypothetical protein VF941_06630 [Clostridia bacterium]
MTEKHPKIGKKKELALSALLTERTVQAAAKIAGVSESSLWRWLREDDFQKEFKALKREVVAISVTKLQKSSATAVETLESIMEDTESPAGARVSEARTVLEMTLKVTELEQVISRLEALEKQVGENR